MPAVDPGRTRAWRGRARRGPWRRTTLALALAAAVAGCATAPDPVRFPELTYAHLGRTRLAVGRIDIVDAYRPPLAPPNVDHRMPASPAATMRRWAEDRLVAAGGDATARFVIRDARVTETELPRDTGLANVLRDQQAQRYDLVMDAALEIVDARGARLAIAAARTTRSRTVSENISANDRERVWFEMVERAAADLSAELDRRIRANLGRYLR
ncbi:MAG: hypothetical protein JNL66_04335 [Alphaproteobacteria bacterium]|nr:hypothetical protein [Alphaproteobacteria bacterium]